MPTIFEVKAVPSSGKTGFTLDSSGIIKCFLKSPAEDGKANRELIKAFSHALNIPQQEITILTGLINPKKRIKISSNLTEEELFACLNITERQNKII